MKKCPQCGGLRIVSGRFTEYGGSGTVVFRPDTLRSLAITLSGGAELNRESLACRDCGLVWNFADPAVLNKFLRRHCRGADD